jgi:hypothetical protein
MGATPATLVASCSRFLREVRPRAYADVDPGERHDWESLALGWLIAAGHDPADPAVHSAAYALSKGELPG